MAAYRNRVNNALQAIIDQKVTLRKIRIGQPVTEADLEDLCSLVLLPIEYVGVKLDAGYRIDLLVESCVIVELKAVEKMNPIFEAQILSYLKLSKLEVGLLINFHVPRLKEGLKRIVNNYQGNN